MAKNNRCILLSLLTRNKGTSVASLLLLILCGQRAPHFHGVSTDGSHPLSPKERAYLGNFTYTFTFLVDQKRGAQDLIYRWCFLKITHKMLVEKISTRRPSQVVLKASGWIAEWLCGHRARSWGQNQLPFSGPPHQGHVPLGPWRPTAGCWWLWVALPSCLVPTQWVMEATSS